jgi:MFS family permease
MFLYMQMELTMPLYAKDSFGTWAVSMLFTVNALTVVTLQVPVSTWLSRRYSMSVNVAAALGCMALGLLLVGLSHGPVVFLAAVFLFTMGEVIIDPQVDATVSDIVPRGTVGTALGIMGGVSALGGSLGNMVGGPVYARMVDLNAGHQFWVWLGFAAVVAALTVLLVGLNMEVPVEEDEA